MRYGKRRSSIKNPSWGLLDRRIGKLIRLAETLETCGGLFVARQKN